MTIQVLEHFHRRNSCPERYSDATMMLLVLIVGVDEPGKLMRAVMSTGAHLMRLEGVSEQPW